MKSNNKLLIGVPAYNCENQISFTLNEVLDLSEKINLYCEQINEFLIANIVDVDVSNIKTFNIFNTEISVVDGVSFYLKEMENIFNFDKIDELLKDKDFYFNNYTEKRSYYIKANRVRVTLCRRQYLIQDAKHIFIF